MNFKLEIWRQFESGQDGAFETFEVSGIDPEASFLEMLDQLNERREELQEIIRAWCTMKGA